MGRGRNNTVPAWYSKAKVRTKYGKERPGDLEPPCLRVPDHQRDSHVETEEMNDDVRGSLVELKLKCCKTSIHSAHPPPSIDMYSTV